MLAPGIVWTEGEHSEESRPIGPCRDLATIPPRAQYEARRARDRTPYCIACDTSLLPAPRGPQRATCEQHSAERNAQRVQASRERATEVNFVVTLSREDARQILRSLDRLQSAVGRGASYFNEADAGTWQHALLLASKELTRVSDVHLRSRYRRAQTAANPARTNLAP